MRTQHVLILLILFGSFITGESHTQGQNKIKKTAQLLPNDICNSYLHSLYDYALSPYTGYTRAHWLEITERIIAGVLPYFDNETLLPQLPPVTGGFAKYEKNSSEKDIPGLRALERTMIAVIFYTKATGRDKVLGYEEAISAPYLKAISEGTNSNSKFYWGDPQPGD